MKSALCIAFILISSDGAASIIIREHDRTVTGAHYCTVEDCHRKCFSTCKFYRCYYPHTPRDSVSPVWGIFTESALWANSFSKSRCPNVVCVCHRGKLAPRWTGDFRSRSVSLILAYLHSQVFCRFDDILRFEEKTSSVFWIFANQPTVHDGGVSRGRVWGCGCWC